jgi:hypothetical protein
MDFKTIPPSAQRAGLILLSGLLILVLFKPAPIAAQRKDPPPVAQVGPGTPLPVYVVNDFPPALPAGFVPGTSWKFTQWTTPSALTFTATVQKTEGGWALLALSGNAAAPQWYFVPQMPGGWEPQ